MKKIVVFYSLEGNTRLIAENIAKTVNADILELKPKKEIPAKGFMKYVWGGRAAMMKTKPELLPLDKDIQNYEVIFIGTPVWAWTYAPPLNAFFTAHPIANKKIALFCCHGGGKGNIFDKLKQVLPGNQILGEIDFQDPSKRNTENNLKKAKDWAKNIVKSL
ncbi:MAG: flavodoxin [Candidatus Omnitrophota bacterium]